MLGRGRVGVVYLAEDVRLNRQAALKLLNPELAADEQFRERFLRESRLATLLDHPNVVPVYEAGEVEGRLYVAMGYVEGTDLASLLTSEGRLEPERALLVVTQLAEALDTARWSRGLVHGGLKPSEVLVAPAAEAGFAERVLLLGFGLRRELPPGARLAEAATPEQIEGRPVSPRTDVYALGCVLFECLTGRPPFNGHSPQALLEAHLREQPPSVKRYCSDLPAAIDRVIAKGMAKWPEERYTTCGELAASAQTALAHGRGQPERARLAPVALPARPEWTVPAGMPPSGATDVGSGGAPDSLAQRLSTRGRKPIAAIGLVLLLAALVAGVIWLTGRDRGDLRSATPASPAAQTPNEAAIQEEAAAPEPPAETEPPPAAESAAAEPTPVVSVRRGSLVRIDARTGEILARVAILAPKLLASDGRSVWVLSGEGARSKLVHIEVLTNSVTETFDAAMLSGLRTSGLAAAGGSAWLSDNFGSVYRLAPGASPAEPVTFEPVTLAWPDGGSRNDRARRQPRQFNFVPGSQVAAAGSLWVSWFPPGPCCSPPPDLYRVDPVTEAVIARIDDAEKVVAAGAGFVWALVTTHPDADADVLVRIDTETHATRPIGVLEFPWADFTAADGAVWASSPRDGTIVRLDPVTGEENERIRVGRKPGALAAGAGAVWAAIRNKGAVARYDIAANRTRTIDVGGTPTDLVFAAGSVWVAVGSDEPAAPAEFEPPAEAETPGGQTQESVSRLTREEYIADVRAICSAASDRFDAAAAELQPIGREWQLEDQAAWYEAAARFHGEALAELRALPPPETGLNWIIDFYSLIELQGDVLRRQAAAASAGDTAREQMLGNQRVALTHQLDMGFGEIGLPTGCPLRKMPA